MTSPARRDRLRTRERAAVALIAALVLTGATGITSAAGAAPVEPAPVSAPGVNGDGVFTIAVMPDTQQEVGDPDDPRFTNRAQWLSDHKAALDLRYVTHVGDVVGWDTDDHAQYAVTDPGVAILDASGVPWSFSIGNHDSLATGPGGGARPGGDASVDMRVTTTFNDHYGVDHADRLRGTFEPGKIDNSFSTFGAEGTRWLVLNLELWPRESVVQWAARVVANHPTFNVAVVTHAMLTAEGTVQQDNGGYGATSPQHLLDSVVLKYPNVRFVFSGHAGTFAHQSLTGVNGNPVELVQQTYHDNFTNPTRLVTIDTRHDSYSSKVYAPYTDVTYTDGSATSRSAMAWV